MIDKKFYWYLFVQTNIKWCFVKKRSHKQLLWWIHSFVTPVLSLVFSAQNHLWSTYLTKIFKLAAWFVLNNLSLIRGYHYIPYQTSCNLFIQWNTVYSSKIFAWYRHIILMKNLEGDKIIEIAGLFSGVQSKPSSC